MSEPPPPPEEPPHRDIVRPGNPQSTTAPRAVHPSGSRRWPWISLAISFVVTIVSGYFLAHARDVNAEFILRRIVWPLFRLLFVVTLTLGLTSIVETLGWSRFVVRIFRPILTVGRFSAASSIAFTTAFFSGIAANTLLANAYRKAVITRRELTLSNLLNIGLPSFVLHLPATLAIIVPFVGKAGVIYASLMFAAALVRTVFVLSWARITLTADKIHHSGPGSSDETHEGIRIQDLLASLARRLFRIGTYTVPIYTVVVTLDRHGFFSWLQERAATYVTTEIMPVEGISVVAFSIVMEFSAGAAAAGAMLDTGVLSVKETVLALLAGNMLATPVRALRHQLPGYLGIFSPGLGTELLVIGQILRLASVAATGWIFYLAW